MGRRIRKAFDIGWVIVFTLAFMTVAFTFGYFFNELLKTQ